MKEKIYSKLNETIYEYVHTSGVRVFMVPKKGFLKSGAYFATHFGSIDYNFVPIGETELLTSWSIKCLNSRTIQMYLICSANTEQTQTHTRLLI